MKTNRFSKALRHLKSTELDEKIQRLQEAPTNNIGGVYADNRGGFRLGEKDPERIFYPDVDGNWPDGIPGTSGEKTYTRPAGYWDSGPGSVPAVDWDVKVDLSHSGTSTDGFINPTDGTVLVNLPPDSRHFILGPLVDGYTYNHGYDDYTNIGYIQKDTRQFILLGRIQGYWKDGAEGSVGAGRNPVREWGGGSDGFTSYNENFTLAMAQWFRDQYNAGTYAKNVSYFYSGGQPQTGNSDPDAPDGSLGGVLPGTGDGPRELDPYGTGGDPNSGTDQDDPNHVGPDEMGFPWELLKKVSKFLNYDSLDMIKNLVLKLGDKAVDVLSNQEGTLERTIEIASKLARVETAGKFLNRYNQFLSNPNGEGSTPQNPIDITSEVSTYDLNLLNKYINGNKEIQNERQKLIDGKYSEKIIKIPGQGSFTEKDLRKEILQNKIEAEVRKAIEKSPGLDNSLHNNVKVDMDQSLETGTTVLTKTYIFRPGGSVEEAENSVIGKVLSASGVKLDTIGSGNPLVFWGGVFAASTGLSNSEKHGGIYKSPGMHYKVVIPNSAGIKESKEVLTESRRRILREVKRPYALPEYPKQKLKKYKPNFAGKYSPQNTPDVTACKESDNIAKAKNAAGQTWRTSDKYWSRYQSTERMNVVFDQVGHGDQYWEMIIDDNKNKKKIRDRKVQEHLNILSHERAMLKENPNFKSPFRENIKEQETIDAPNDPLFNRVSKKLKTVIDYPDKPSPNGYPDDLPPQQVNGWHQDYGKRDGYYNKLDPQSAEAMPPTGNPDIDAKVQKAKRIKQMAKKRA